MLRIGILLDSTTVSKWVADILDKLNHPSIKLVAVFINQSTTKPRNNTKVLYKFFRSIDRAFLPGRPDVFEKVILELPADVPLYNMHPVKKGIRNSFSEEDLSIIKEHKPEVLLRFGFGILTGEILTLPRYGVWSLHHGDVDWFRGGPPGFWEWLQWARVTGVTLQRLTEELDGGICLAKTITKTDYTSFSRNQNVIFSKGIDLMADEVIKLALTEKYEPASQSPTMYSGPLYKDPDLWYSALAFCKLAARSFQLFITRNFFNEQWVLFYSLTGSSGSFVFRKFKELIPPSDRIWADPFVISQNGRHYVFIEELILSTNKGHISCLVLNERGRVETASIIIDKPYHLSYPFIFQHEGKWYMIPESALNRTVDIYECVNFPFEWKFVKTLLEGFEAFDATIHRQDNYFWLFCTIRLRQGASANDDLHVFYTDDLLNGKWHSHRMNPVVNNPSNARPAGRIFFQDGSWYRPAQNCTPRYGYGIALNRIVKLDTNQYEEVKIASATPQWRKKLLTMHTLNFTDSITVTDGQIKRFKFSRAGIRPMKILFVMDSVSTGGAEYSTLRLAGWLKREKRWDVKLVYFKDKHPSYSFSDFGLDDNVHRIVSKSFFYKWVKLMALIRDWKPSIVHSVLLYSNFFCRLTRLFHRTPVFIESLVNRTYDESRFRDPKVNKSGLKFFRFADKVTQKFGTDYFHSVTNDIAQHFREHTGTSLKKITVVYRGRTDKNESYSFLEREQKRLSWSFDKDTIIFLTAGRHEFQKGHIYLLKAYQQFLKVFDGKSCLLIAGREGSETAVIEKFIAENNLTDKVRLLGHRDDLPDLMLIADVFILPSLFEGIGGVLIEAEASGLPIICSDLAGLKEVVEQNENAITVPAAQVEVLNEAMIRLAKDAELRIQFAKRSREIFSERFQENASHQNMVNFYLSKVYN